LKRHSTGGFTLIELMIVVAIVGLLSAVAIPTFIKYLRQAKTVEAVEGLDKIKIGAREYYVVDHWSSAGTLLDRQFPNGISQVPSAGPCCQRCINSSNDWDNHGWGVIKFGLTDPHYYAYSFTTTGMINSAQYTANAMGDLDCDGKNSTFQIRGSICTESDVVIVGPIITDELE
jgi:prepilin-type N-terminal cleavage/methylation domain-containing protein